MTAVNANYQVLCLFHIYHNMTAVNANYQVLCLVHACLQVSASESDGEIGGMIKTSGTFPVFGNIAVDGSVPSHGTAYVDTANVFANECACFN
ncbi:hypothetical protein ABMA28_011126 [Loxostege sticticalis]|uniref:Uncharacterized protein n=1 Tax=Loxostege sticticalis TaxID=481309 RepID=A0ABD0S6A3_LOXSC